MYIEEDDDTDPWEGGGTSFVPDGWDVLIDGDYFDNGVQPWLEDNAKGAFKFLYNYCQISTGAQEMENMSRSGMSLDDQVAHDKRIKKAKWRSLVMALGISGYIRMLAKPATEDINFVVYKEGTSLSATVGTGVGAYGSFSMSTPFLPHMESSEGTFKDWWCDEASNCGASSTDDYGTISGYPGAGSFVEPGWLAG